jgi:hypothetical protein
MFVIVAIFALLGMAALAIDLVTLYVAKGQAQRVADAAALAGAKTLVERGITADPTDTHGTWTATCTQARAQAIRIADRGLIGGVLPGSVTLCFPNGGACDVTCPAPGAIGTGYGVNPQVSVMVRSEPLPLFFSKIWGQPTATVSATGQAEGFNPSGTDIPVAAKCVTPWLLPNIDPATGAPIFNTTNGQITNNIPRIAGGPGGFVGETFQLTTGCPPAGCGIPNPPVSTNGIPTPPATLSYYPLDLPNPAVSGPSCAVGASYQQNITACNRTPIACGSQVSLDTTVNPNNVGNNQLAIDCLIGAAATGSGNGQDTLNMAAFPYAINAGTTHNGVANGTQISTSRSVVTIPVYDSGAGVAPGSPVVVIGFVQAFVGSSDAATGDPTIQILNVSGCSAVGRASSVTPVGMNEASPVPVRLIHP